MSDLFLSPEQLHELTGKKQRSAQIRVLEERGYTYRLDGNGRILVSRAHIERVFDGKDQDPTAAIPDFSWVKRGRQAEKV